jgi:carboxypeptidase C (cathepsin A)
MSIPEREGASQEARSRRYVPLGAGHEAAMAAVAVPYSALMVVAAGAQTGSIAMLERSGLLFSAHPCRSLARRIAVVALLAVAGVGLVAVPAGWNAAFAQRAQRSEPPQAGAEKANASENQPRRAQAHRELPADVTTEQSVELSGRTLRFKATAGSIPLNDPEGALQAEIAYVAYVRDGEARPVTFVFNGGPGAASAYLNIGALGPWRLPLTHVAPSSPTTLEPNEETWLDFTDLVFVDPPGTGYSRIAVSGEEARRRFWSIDGDAEALAVFVRKWLEQAGRQSSAKFIVGESYGGFRGPKIARKLADQGVGVRGLVLISPVLDFAAFGERRHAPMTWVAHLPSMAATVLDAKGGPDRKFDRDALRDVERYAAGDYLLDLMKGERDEAAVERISARVAALTGLDPALVRRLAGRVDTATFQREFHRGQGLVGSAYDPTITAYDPNPTAAVSRFPDPMLDGSRAPLTTAMTDLYQHTLNWRVEKPYQLLNGEISSHWNWGRGRTGPEVVSDLRNALAGDPHVRVLVAHGANDLVTPYFGNQLLLQQLPVFGSADRVRLAVYGGGHMFYDRDASRRAFRDDATALFHAALKPVAGE